MLPEYIKECNFFSDQTISYKSTFWRRSTQPKKILFLKWWNFNICPEMFMYVTLHTSWIWRFWSDFFWWFLIAYIHLNKKLIHWVQWVIFFSRVKTSEKILRKSFLVEISWKVIKITLAFQVNFLKSNRYFNFFGGWIEI